VGKLEEDLRDVLQEDKH